MQNTFETLSDLFLGAPGTYPLLPYAQWRALPVCRTQQLFGMHHAVRFVAGHWKRDDGDDGAAERRGARRPIADRRILRRGGNGNFAAALRDSQRLVDAGLRRRSRKRSDGYQQGWLAPSPPARTHICMHAHARTHICAHAHSQTFTFTVTFTHTVKYLQSSRFCAVLA